jgi:TonB family protein
MNKLLTVVATVFLCGQLLFAQGPNDGYIMENDAEQHVISHPDPVYPAIAKAAHIQGSVLVHADVDERGTVTKVEAIGGSPMLRGAATEAVKHWTYRPFEVSGKVSPVKIVVSVPFSLGIPSATEKSDQAIGQAYFPKSDECRAATASGAWDKALLLCGDMNTIASRFPDESLRHLEIQDAHIKYGEALAFNKRLSEALLQFNAAVALAQKYLKPNESEYAEPFYWQAFVEHAQGSPVEGDRDYAISEESYRNAIANLPDMKVPYGRALAHVLSYHAILMDQLGRTDDAARMRADAKTFDPNVIISRPATESKK